MKLFIKSNIFSVLVLTLALGIYVNLIRTSAKWQYSGPGAVISWDVATYYSYLPFYFFGDLKTLSNGPYIYENYNPWGGQSDWYGAYKTQSGNYVIKTTCGLSILYFPAFAVATIWAKYKGVAVDGYSYPYQKCMAFYPIFFALIGLFFLMLLLRKHFSDITTSLILITIALASNYLNFATISGNMAHNYLFTLIAILLYCTDKYFETYKLFYLMIMAFLTGFCVLIRPTELLIVIVLPFWNTASGREMKERMYTLVKKYHHLLIFAVIVFLVNSIQLIYWYKVTGHFMYWSYDQNEGFDFINAQIGRYLFSYKKGWFVYTPVMLLAVTGIFFSVFHKKPNAWPVLLYLSASVFVLSSWSCWWYGGSFSQRSIIQSYAILAFPLGYLYTWLLKSKVSTFLMLGFLVFCIWMNGVMTYQANYSWIMDCNNMTKEKYWSIFGKLH